MRRLLHISDLHFGRTRPDLLDPLVETIDRLAADLVVISGDFTQRARIGQYEEARAFLDRIRQPWFAVPGNHDTPLDNVFLRFTSPWRRYKRYITRNLHPVWEDDVMKVVGINTVNRFSWQRGRISPRTLSRIEREFGHHTRDKVTVAVMHHPLEHGPEVEKRLMRGARAGLAALHQRGADIVLSGHLHNTHVAPFTTQPGVLFVQAGTGLSTRLRGEDNTFNLLTLDHDHVELERWAAGERPAFEVVERAHFVREGPDWAQVDDVVLRGDKARPRRAHRQST